MSRRSCMRRASANFNRVVPLTSVEEPKRQALYAKLPVFIYNWGLWGFVTILLFAQVFEAVISNVTSQQHIKYGQDPRDGLSLIGGFNDEPYSDRMIVCTLQGRLYKPRQLSAALRSSIATVIDATGTAINGYRVCLRDQIQLEQKTFDQYEPLCGTIGATLEGICDSCSALGYNVTRDALRIVEGVDSSTMKILSNTLPVLIMPYWDNGILARYVIPGWDGNACVFGLIDNARGQSTSFFGGSQSVIATKTSEWLGQGNGVWRNGWYEDPSGIKWYSYLSSSDPTSEVRNREFDPATGVEINQLSSSYSASVPQIESWGTSLRFSDATAWYTSIAISNGSRYGLFLYEALDQITAFRVYSIDILISNSSLGLLLFRWLTVITAFQNSIIAEKTKLIPVGLGCISSSQYFTWLPVILLPRLKTTLAAFFVVGCQFEGEQKALAEAWFVVYPAIGEFVLLYFSLLSLLAKLLRRRVSDVLFGPTLVFFFFMHLFRFELAQSDWFEFDGRIATVVLSQEFDKLRIMDFLTTDAALRMNGNIKSLFTIKMVVLALNLAPFVWSTNTNVSRVKVPPLEIEQALALRAITVGGLGRSFQHDVKGYLAAAYLKNNAEGRALPHMLPSYELARLGYLILGDRYLISIKEWFWFMIFSPVRSHQPFANLQLCVYVVSQSKDGSSRFHPKPRFIRLDGSAISDISCRDISLRPLR